MLPRSLVSLSFQFCCVIYWVTAVVNATLLRLVAHKMTVTVNVGDVCEVVMDFTL